MVELEPQTLLDVTTFLVGVACGALATSGLALGGSLWLRAWVEAKPAKEGGDDAIS